MEGQPLTPQTLKACNMPDASQCWLSMELYSGRVDVRVSPLAGADGMHQVIRRRIPLDSAKGYVAAFEDAVYGNPLLLSDFAVVGVLVDTRRFMVVPSVISDQALYQQMMSVLWPADDYDVLYDEVTDSDTLLWAIDSALLGFVRRTFINVDISHRLAQLSHKALEQARGDSRSYMYVDVHPLTTDIMFMRDGKLAVLCTYDTPQPSDVLYYIMAVAQAAEFSAEYDWLLLTGDVARQGEVLPEASRYIRNIRQV